MVGLVLEDFPLCNQLIIDEKGRNLGRCQNRLLPLRSFRFRDRMVCSECFGRLQDNQVRRFIKTDDGIHLSYYLYSEADWLVSWKTYIKPMLDKLRKTVRELKLERLVFKGKGRMSKVDDLDKQICKVEDKMDKWKNYNEKWIKK